MFEHLDENEAHLDRLEKLCDTIPRQVLSELMDQAESSGKHGSEERIFFETQVTRDSQRLELSDAQW